MNAQNETKHTPGPWDWDKGTEPHFQSVVYGEGNGRNIAVCYNDESNANARLIAAAPELLETLGSIAAWLVAPDLSPETLEHFRAKARAAIAKATESPN